MIKANIDGKEVELSPDEIELGDGFALITPDNVPKGYFNEEAVNNIVKENVNKTKESVKSNLLEDEEFHKSILSRHNIQLGEDGKPKGLKPTVDVDEVKQNVTKELSSKYEKELDQLKNQIDSRNKAVIKNSIMSTVKGKYKEDWIKPFGDDEPLVIKQFADKFTVDENGNAVLKDNENGGVKYKGDGKPYTPQDYLLDESQFGELFSDKRQRGTGTSPAGNNSTRVFSEEEIANMGDDEYEKNREAILESAGK